MPTREFAPMLGWLFGRSKLFGPREVVLSWQPRTQQIVNNWRKHVRTLKCSTRSLRLPLLWQKNLWHSRLQRQERRRGSSTMILRRCATKPPRRHGRYHPLRNVRSRPRCLPRACSVSAHRHPSQASPRPRRRLQGGGSYLAGVRQ